MCTAISYQNKNFYFGRNLDCEYSYGEEVVVTPRNYVFKFREHAPIQSHYAMVGMAHVDGDYPLYYEAMNEKGLGIAGLNFAGNAVYNEHREGKDNITQFELIPWLLAQCANTDEAIMLLTKLNIRNLRYSEDYPLAELHWLMADAKRAVTVEAVKAGLRVYVNPVGVLTNNPTFDKQLFNLNNYIGLSPRAPENNFAKGLVLDDYSRGMGSLGLPGDPSSMSRFVRASFIKLNSVADSDEMSSVNQFFHILHSVEQQRGCTVLGKDKYEITSYSSCYSAQEMTYYYTTYTNHQINAIDMRNINLDMDALVRFRLASEETVNRQN